MLNPFFLNGSKAEQNLLQDLVNESIKMHGVEVYYLPRKFIGEKTIIREVVASVFDTAMPIETYVISYDGWEGQGDTLSKFGIETKDELVLAMSQERYETYIQPLIIEGDNLKLTSRPKEGDLIYFPLGDRLFEIKHVKRDNPFYQLQKNYIYELRCELFRYEDEVIDTSISEIDDEVEDIGYICKMSLIDSAITATGTVDITTEGSVKFIQTILRGSNYSSLTEVTMSPPVVGYGTTAAAVAITSTSGSISNYIDRILITDPGIGYTTSPSISIRDTDGSGALAFVGIATFGSVTDFTVTNPGGPYINPPTVTFVQSPGSGYTTPIAEAVLNQYGNLIGIRYQNTGDGYTVAPDIIFSDPEASSPSLINNGFTLNEIITGSVSGATARVKSWDNPTKKLDISIISGDFIDGEMVMGDTNGSVLVIGNINLFDENNAYADNDTIEEEADNLLDFTERNPFGEV